MAIVLPILTTFNPAGIKSAQTALGGLGGVMSKLGKTVATATIAYQGLQSVINFAGDAITSARDLERNMSAMNTVFGQLSPRMEAFAKNAYTMGISQSEAAKTATFLGSVLKQAGFSMDEVASKTESLTVLAQDLATTYGYDTSEALTAMTALFRGEYDPIEKFGVALKQNEVNALVAAKGLGNLTGQALLNAQQQVRLEQLFKRSADAQGAFARQSGSLFVEQKKLNAVWETMQATVGQKLTPAIADLMGMLVPLVNTEAPKLTYAFEQIGKVIEDLEVVVRPLINVFGNLIGAIGSLLNALEPLIKVVLATLAVALELLADLLTHIGNGVNELVGIFSTLWDSVNQNWGESLIFSWIKDFIDNSVILKAILDPIVAAVERIGELTANGAKGPSVTDETSRFLRQRLERLGNVPGPSGVGAAGGATGKAAKDTVKEFYQNLADEMKKQSAKLKLAKLGASDAFIDSVLGSGADWQKVFKKITAGGAAMVAKLQKQFNKTAAGLNEIAAAQKAAEAAAAEAAAAAEELRQLKKEFASSIREGFSTLLAKEAPALGKFQQAVVDSFTAIKQTIMDADSRILSKKKKATFLGLAEFAQQQMEKIAKQRDVLAAKIESAKSFMDSVKDSIFGQVNLSDMGKTATMIIANFKRIVQRSVEFRKNIALLSQAGLNSTALQQIVAGGAEAGGAAAKALVAGGAGAIGQVNDLFGQLEQVAGGVAETAGQALFGAGVDASNGLINGLLAQEDELKKAAETLANSFQTAFNKRLGLAKPEFSPIGIGGTTQAGTVVNLTVNAPMGSGSNIGKLIIDEISRYERTSGMVFARA